MRLAPNLHNELPQWIRSKLIAHGSSAQPSRHSTTGALCFLGFAAEQISAEIKPNGPTISPAISEGVGRL
jgi:hypothetical protein